MSRVFAPVEVVRDLPATQGTDPEFDRLRQLHAIVRAKAGPHMEAFIAEADEIQRLRERFLGVGHGGARKGSSFTPVKLDQETGFCAKLKSELGLQPEQAKRLEERADYVRRLRLAAAGQPVPYITGTGRAKEAKTFKPDDQAALMARSALEAVMAGDVPPSRAWAGLVGEGKRVAESGKKERAAVDHAMNISNAIAKLKTSLPHWREISAIERAHIENEFNAIKHLMDGTLQ